MPFITSSIIRTYVLAESDGTEANVYLSSDLGDTWFQSGKIEDTAVFDIKADPTYGGSAVVGAANGIYYTKDGGYTWTKASGTYTSANGNFKQISYVDSDYVFAIGDNHIVFSQTGGTYFTDLVSTSSLYGVGALGYSIFFIDQFKGIVGIEDKVYVTADGGFTWTPGNSDVALVVGEPVYSVAMNSDFVTINAATINNVLQSTDFAVSFAITYTAPAPFTNRQKLLRYSDSTYYLLSNNNGDFEVSTDSGLTWTNQSTITGSYVSNNVIDLLFYSATDGLVLPDATSVRKTSDSGINFTSIPLPDDDTAISVSAAEEKCNACPDGYTKIPGKDDCIKTETSPYLCTSGIFNPATSSCDSTNDCYSDIMLILDASISISSGEMTQQKNLSYGIVSNLQSTLGSGVTGNQFGVVSFATIANLEQGLTSNFSLINAGINAVPVSAGVTVTLYGICTAVTELETNGRVGANKVIVLLTDGVPNIATISCVYDNVPYAGASAAVQSLCSALKANGYIIILIPLGSSPNANTGGIVEIEQVQSVIGSNSLNPIYSNNYEYPIVFADAPTIASVISQSICNVSTLVSCDADSGWSLYVVPGSDPLNAVCKRNVIIPIIKCCFQLEDCLGVQADIYTGTDLTDLDGQVIQISEFPDTCWTITNLSDQNLFCDDQNTKPVTVTNNFDNCDECVTRYKFVNCQDCNVVLYSTQDFADAIGSVITFDEYPNTCWVASETRDNPYTPEILTNSTKLFNDCSECLKHYFKLVNCNNEDIFIYVNDIAFEPLVGSAINITGYPGLCWRVERPDCNCIRTSIKPDDGPAVNYELTSAGTLNEKNVYFVNISGTDYGIGWNDVLLRWELYNNTNGDVLSYSLNQNDCPFDGAWTKGDLQVLYVQPCIDAVYDTAIDKVYPNCECCLNNCI